MKPTRLLMVMLTLFVATKGTSQGAVSDLDGNFTIQANPNTTLVLSYIGKVRIFPLKKH